MTDGRAETNCKEEEVNFTKDLPVPIPDQCTSAMTDNGVDSSKVKSLAETVDANLEPHSSSPDIRNF